MQILQETTRGRAGLRTPHPPLDQDLAGNPTKHFLAHGMMDAARPQAVTCGWKSELPSNEPALRFAQRSDQFICTWNVGTRSERCGRNPSETADGRRAFGCSGDSPDRRKRLSERRRMEQRFILMPGCLLKTSGNGNGKVRKSVRGLVGVG